MELQTDITILAAFGAGLLSFLSPCVLPLVPAYFGSLIGPELFDQGKKKNNYAVFLHALMFVAGFAVVFTLLGTVAGLIGLSFTSQVLLKNISGIILIIFGVFILLSLKFPWLNFEKRLTPKASSTTGYLRSLFIGMVFSLAWTPCVGPILGGVLALALDSATAWQGAYLLLFYSIGLGIPFLIIGIAFDFLTPVLKGIQRYSLYIYIVSGLLLVTAGILTLVN